MAEEKTDRRVQRTRRGLHDALIALILEKRYDKITVQDIIDRANVGRSTFYSHFLDKGDLLLHGLQAHDASFDAHVHSVEHKPQGDHVLHSLVFFEHAYENSEVYRAMLNGGGADFIFESSRRHITADIERHLEALIDAGEELVVPLEVATRFLAGAMMSVLSWWLQSNMPYLPKEIDGMYQRLARPLVRELTQPSTGLGGRVI